MAAKKSAKKGKRLRAQKSGKGPTKGEPKCGARRGIDYPGEKCTRDSGHDGKHRNKDSGATWS